MRYPFEATPQELASQADAFVDAVFSCLESEFMVMPRGEGFIDYPVFEAGYEALKKATHAFGFIDPDAVTDACMRTPMCLIVLRTILGFTPPEWAYVATQQTGVDVTQGFARSLDRRIRMDPMKPLARAASALQRIAAMVRAACALLASPVAGMAEDRLHRLDKADTRGGLASLRTVSTIGVPYAMLLYERFLGRPFAAHRDSVSELVGGNLEASIERCLDEARVSFRKTGRAERISGFDQAPDFIAPSEFNPKVVIEAKVTEDDGTARDKVTRVQHLAELSRSQEPGMPHGFEVVACIGGRGFGVRREDMRKLILDTQGKVFTLRTLDRLVSCTRLNEFRAAHNL